MAEIVRVGLHGQSIHTDNAWMLFLCVVLTIVVVVVVSCFGKHAVGDEVFACAVAIHDGADEVLGHILVVSQ